MNDKFKELGARPRHIVAAGILVLALSWLLDAAIDRYVFHDGPLLQQMIAPSVHDIWGRLVNAFLLFAFIIYVTFVALNRHRLAMELQRAMMKVEGEKARTEGIIAAIGDGLSIQDKDLRVLFQNEVHKKLVGGDFVGEYCYTAYNCRDQVCPECPVAMCFRDGLVHKVQKAASPRLGISHIEITASPLRDEKGNVIAGIELLRDISLNKQAEEQVRLSEMRFRNLVESTSDWVWEVDENGVYTYASPRVRELLGYEPGEVIGKTPFDFMPQEEVQRVSAAFSSAAAECKPLQAIVNTNLHKAGHLVVLETSCVPIFGDDGVFRGYRGIDRDITSRTQAENNIKALNEELSQRAAQLAIANKELDAFSSSVSHDLRTPLTRIYSASQILRESYIGDLGEEGTLLVQTICDGCENMEELIEALVSLSRVSSSELNRSACDLSCIAEILAAELRLSEPSRRVDFEIAPRLVENVDARLIKVLLENLIGNAWKYTQKTAEALIEVGATAVDGMKVYFVRDNGVGFDMEKAQDLFKPFQRLHDSVDFPGTGIGLATVQRIVERHGGQVWGEGEVGRGATFYFTLK